MKTWFVTATRSPKPVFDAEGPLARSLARAGGVAPHVLAVAHANTQPLAVAYNQALDAAAADDVIAFAHDDAWIDDWCVVDRPAEALRAFDVIGVAGNRERRPGQRAWLDAEDLARIADPHLSGAIARRRGEGVVPNRYGPAPAPVKLLDGVFLAARGRAEAKRRALRRTLPVPLLRHGLLPSCERAGLSMGTGPIALTHASGGTPHGAAFDAAARAYFEKWAE